jgi:hypothetical protein
LAASSRASAMPQVPAPNTAIFVMGIVLLV